MLHGLQRLDEIKYAVLEESGGISIIPARDQDGYRLDPDRTPDRLRRR